MTGDFAENKFGTIIANRADFFIIKNKVNIFKNVKGTLMEIRKSAYMFVFL